MAVIDSRQNGILSVLAESNTDNPIDIIRAFISNATGIELKSVIKDFVQKPGTRPSLATDWCGVRISDIRSFGTPYHKGIKGDISEAEGGTVISTVHQTLTVDVIFYGPNAEYKADTLRDALWLGQNVDYLRSQGLTIQGCDDASTSFPEFVYEQWCNRADLKMFLGRVVTRTYGIRDIASVADSVEIIKG